MYCGQVLIEEKYVASLLLAAASLGIHGLCNVTEAVIQGQVSKTIF